MSWMRALAGQGLDPGETLWSSSELRDVGCALRLGGLFDVDDEVGDLVAGGEDPLVGDAGGEVDDIAGGDGNGGCVPERVSA